MSPQDKVTAIALGIFGLIQFITWTLLLGWEIYAAANPSRASLITTVVRKGWHAQAWVVLLVTVVITGVLSFLGGHFFAAGW